MPRISVNGLNFYKNFKTILSNTEDYIIGEPGTIQKLVNKLGAKDDGKGSYYVKQTSIATLPGRKVFIQKKYIRNYKSYFQ